MSYSDLNYLELSGVRWEISDTPIMAPKITTTPDNDILSTPRPTAATVIAEIGRSASSVVPPIAPVATISVETVRSMATRPNDTSTLNRMIGEFNHPLRPTATNTVLPHFGNGKLLIITDTPGPDDDSTGRVLSGAPGDLMDKMLSAIGESRETTSIVPIIFWRTPGGRTPTTSELELARPFIDRAIELIKPRVILTLGTLPATQICGVNLAKSHGTPVTTENNGIIIPIFHPNYLILKPTAKRDVWTVLQNVQNILKSAE
ncbi:MAG: uracil-DNA glycosylase [Alphaproteobacteria bacterium]|nr:uracil-DNA glycosylase [Alphaproteobacteria bacterium]